MLPVRASICLAALLVAALFIYLPGIGGPYLADDFPNIVNNPHLLLDSISWESLKDAALSSPASPYHRPLSMLSFTLGYTAAGSMDPASAKFMNVLLHLGTGLLAYFLARTLLQILRVPGIDAPQEFDVNMTALLAAGMWLLHPLFVSTVLYTVQRMSILSALFVMAGCLFYLRRRPLVRDARDCAVLLSGIALFTTLAFLCKENGALLPGFLFLIEIAAFRFRFDPGVHGIWRAGITAMLAVPAALILSYLAALYLERGALEAPAYYFTIHERLLTQFRALTQYAGWLGLISIEPMGLYHDDFTLSTSLTEPPATVVSLVLWIAATIMGAVLTAKRQLIGFGIMWFLWGHALESSVIALAPVFEHRNYLPGFGLILAIVGTLYGAMQHVRMPRAGRLGMLILILLALPAYQLRERVTHWSDERAFIIRSVQDHPESALTLLSAAVFLDSHGDPAGALAALRQAQLSDPREVALIYAEFVLHCEHQPGRLPDPELGRRLLAASAESPRTVTARKQFVEMVKVCSSSSASDDILMEVYAGRLRDRNEDVAMISQYGIGAVHLHRGEYPEAVAAWAGAVENFRDGESLRPLLDDLRRKMHAE